MTSVTLTQAQTIIARTGHLVTYLLESEPGVGKSAMLAALAESMPTHKPVYLEAQTLDLGDVQMPRVTNTGVHFIPNSAFVSDGKPLIVMLDEIGKAMRPVQNALLRLMHERKLGEHTLPDNSIVFATTNLASDGVGDNMQSHALNRITRLRVAKPDADQWAAWAMGNEVAPEVTAWVLKYPHCLASYTDPEQGDNPYIFNPKRPAPAFVSPRSLEKASHIVKERIHLTPEVLIAALTGTVGASAARDMEAHLVLGDAIPDWRRVVEYPETCPVPDNHMAHTILALGAVQRLDKSNVDGWLTYMARLSPESMALFAMQAMKTPKSAILAVNRKFSMFCQQYSWVF